MGWDVGASSYDDPVRVPQRWRRHWREWHGWSCAEVADHCELGRNFIPGARALSPLVARWENENATPDGEQLQAWLDCLDHMVDHPHRALMPVPAYEFGLCDALGDPPRPRDRVWLLFERCVRERWPIYADADLTRDVVLGKGVEQVNTF